MAATTMCTSGCATCTRSIPSGAAMIAIRRIEVAPAFFTTSIAAVVELPVASMGSSTITSRWATSVGSFT